MAMVFTLLGGVALMVLGVGLGATATSAAWVLYLLGAFMVGVVAAHLMARAR